MRWAGSCRDWRTPRAQGLSLPAHLPEVVELLDEELTVRVELQDPVAGSAAGVLEDAWPVPGVDGA